MVEESLEDLWGYDAFFGRISSEEAVLELKRRCDAGAPIACGEYVRVLAVKIEAALRALWIPHDVVRLFQALEEYELLEEIDKARRAAEDRGREMTEAEISKSAAELVGSLEGRVGRRHLRRTGAYTQEEIERTKKVLKRLAEERKP